MKKLLFLIIFLFSFLVLFPKNTFAASCSQPNGFDQCTSDRLFQTCIDGQWQQHDCRTQSGADSSFYCVPRSSGSVSCIKGCQERGNVCQPPGACPAGTSASSTYYCSSGTSCCLPTTETCSNTANGTCKSSSDCSASNGTPASKNYECSGSSPICCLPGNPPPPPPDKEGCALCDQGYVWVSYTKKCVGYNYDTAMPDEKDPKEIQQCDSKKGEVCWNNGCGCGITDPCNQLSKPPDQPPACNNGSCDTAIGTINAKDFGSIAKILFQTILSIGAAIGVLLIIWAGYKMIISRGNPEALQGAREQLTAAIVGLLFIIFSLLILQVIGYNILGIKAFQP